MRELTEQDFFGWELKEHEIKAVLLNRLRDDRVIDRRSVLTTEFRIAGSAVRADLAVLGDEFVGVEIKSRFDTLRRLPHQISVYPAYFDRTILVVDKKHLAALAHIDLSFVEVWALNESRLDQVSLPIQSAKKRPMAELLTGNQRARHTDFDHDGGRSAFIAEFRARFGATSKEFWEEVRRSKIRVENLSTLSRFRGRRELGAKMRTERALSWSQWDYSRELV